MDVSYDVTQTHAKSIWVEYLDGLGHFIMLEDSQAFNRHLANYINEFVTGTYAYEK
jgi:hypothetical protein